MENQILKQLKNKKVKEFFKSSLIVFNEGMAKMQANFEAKTYRIKALKFEKFNYLNRYDGDLKDKIFIFKHDAYRGNSSVQCTAECLIHPNSNLEDRGYLKGICLDLTNYLELRNLHGFFQVHHEFFYLSGQYPKNKAPKFRKSNEKAHKEMQIVGNFFASQINAKLEELRAEELKIWQEHTGGLSIPFYPTNF